MQPPAAPAPRPATQSRNRPLQRRPLERAAPPKVALSPAVAALRFGERIRPNAEPSPPAVDAEVVAAPVTTPPAAAGPTNAPFDPSLVLLVGLGLGALLLALSVTPDAILARGPLGSSAVRARLEVGLVGGATVALVTAMYLIVASP